MRVMVNEEALTQLRKAFDAHLVAEVKRYGGIPEKSPEEFALIEAIAVLLASASGFKIQQSLMEEAEAIPPHVRTNRAGKVLP